MPRNILAKVPLVAEYITVVGIKYFGLQNDIYGSEYFFGALARISK